jgi:hypothetical protein
VFRGAIRSQRTPSAPAAGPVPARLCSLGTLDSLDSLGDAIAVRRGGKRTGGHQNCCYDGDEQAESWPRTASAVITHDASPGR